MTANVDIRRIVKSFFYHFFLSFHAGIRREYFLKRLLPCSLCICLCNFHVFVRKCCCLCHFTDHCVSDCKLRYFLCRNLCYNISKCRHKEISCVHIMIYLHTHTVTKCHLADRRCNTVSVQRVSRDDSSCLNILSEFSIDFHHLIVFRNIILICWNAKPYKLITCRF